MRLLVRIYTIIVYHQVHGLTPVSPFRPLNLSRPSRLRSCKTSISLCMVLPSLFYLNT